MRPWPTTGLILSQCTGGTPGRFRLGPRVRGLGLLGGGRLLGFAGGGRDLRLLQGGHFDAFLLQLVVVVGPLRDDSLEEARAPPGLGHHPAPSGRRQQQQHPTCGEEPHLAVQTERVKAPVCGVGQCLC